MPGHIPIYDKLVIYFDSKCNYISNFFGQLWPQLRTADACITDSNWSGKLPSYPLFLSGTIKCETSIAGALGRLHGQCRYWANWNPAPGNCEAQVVYQPSTFPATSGWKPQWQELAIGCVWLWNDGVPVVCETNFACKCKSYTQLHRRKKQKDGATEKTSVWLKASQEETKDCFKEWM